MNHKKRLTLVEKYQKIILKVKSWVGGRIKVDAGLRIVTGNKTL
jgi:hypothetical protein